MEYTLRKLEARDVFRFVNIIKKIGFADIKGAFQSSEVQDALKGVDGTDEAALERVGMVVLSDVAGTIIDNLGKVEGDIYELLSSLSGIEADDVKALPIDVFASMIVDVFKKEEFRDFFKAAARLTK